MAKAPAKKTTTQKDWVTPVAIVGGGAALAVGAFLILKHPAHAEPGGDFKVKFTFNYNGAGGPYVLQVSLGRIWPLGIFDHIEGMTWTMDVDLGSPGTYEFEMVCTLPEAVAEKTYDGEAIIRTPGMDEFDYLIKLASEGVVRVEA